MLGYAGDAGTILRKAFAGIMGEEGEGGCFGNEGLACEVLAPADAPKRRPRAHH